MDRNPVGTEIATCPSKTKLALSIESIDLTTIKLKLMDSEEGESWSRERVDRVERQYRQFLTLCAKYPGSVVPTKQIDVFWHHHILMDTQKYAFDCAQIFGYFLHHFAHFGLKSKEDRRSLDAAFGFTVALLEAEFGAGDHWELVKRPAGVTCTKTPNASHIGFGSITRNY